MADEKTEKESSPVKEAMDQLRTTIYDRITSPLGASFILSWVVINHKYILAMFSPLEINDKIRLLSSLYRWGTGIDLFWCTHLHLDYGRFVHLFGYPVISAAFFILIYPFVSWGCYGIWLWFKEKSKATRDKIEKNTMLTTGEGIAMIQNSLKKEKDIKEIFDRLEEQINDKKQDAFSLRRELIDIKARENRLQEELKILKDNSLLKEKDRKNLIDQLADKQNEVEILKTKLGQSLAQANAINNETHLLLKRALSIFSTNDVESVSVSNLNRILGTSNIRMNAFIKSVHDLLSHNDYPERTLSLTDKGRSLLVSLVASGEIEGKLPKKA